jgi:Putative zinc-finger
MMDQTAHPPDGVLRAFLDGEASAAARVEVERHLATCASCSARLTALEQASAETGKLLTLLTPEPLLLDPEAVIRRARVRSLSRPGVIAAAALVLAVGVASAMVGGSRARAFALRVWSAVTSAPRNLPSSEPQGQGGIAFVPTPDAEIAFDMGQDQGVLRVTMADTAEISIRASGPVAYRVGASGIVLHNQGSSASYDIVVPRDAQHLRILIAGRVVLEKLGPRISTGVPSDRAGRFVLSVR